MIVLMKQVPPPAPAIVVLTNPTVTVSDLADMMKVKGSEVLKHLMLDLGIMATITQSIDADTARKVADNFGVKVQTAVFSLENRIECTQDPGWRFPDLFQAARVIEVCSMICCVDCGAFRVFRDTVSSFIWCFSIETDWVSHPLVKFSSFVCDLE